MRLIWILKLDVDILALLRLTALAQNTLVPTMSLS